MSSSTSPAIQLPDSRFWLLHLWIPLFIAAVTLYSFEHSSIDLDFANYLFQLQGGEWVDRKSWFFYEIMHHRGKQLVISFGVIMIALFIASYKVKSLAYWRWSLGFSVITMTLLPTFIAKLKHISGVPCPWNIDQFGGISPYLHTFQYSLGADTGHCFPAGHSSGGFALLALFFAFWPFLTKHRYLLLLPGLIIGISFGLAQQFRGAHFISHDLWSAAICWFGGLLFFKIALLINSPVRKSLK